VRLPCWLGLVAFAFAPVRVVMPATSLTVMPDLEPLPRTGSTPLGSLAAADIRRHARVIAGAGGVRDVATACGTGGERFGVRQRLSKIA